MGLLTTAIVIPYSIRKQWILTRDVNLGSGTYAEEEALAIATVLRETSEDPGKTAALITPDRALARRVLAALGRWKVPVDDSGGDPLADTPAPGVFRYHSRCFIGVQ